MKIPTAFSLLRKLCGLSQAEAAAFHQVSIDSVQSWDSGRRAVPAGIIAEMRDLAGKIDDAASKALEVIAKRGTPMVELGIAADDAEAQSIGVPCVGAHEAILARVVAELPDEITCRIVPRGSTSATAAAADAHEAALRKRGR